MPLVFSYPTNEIKLIAYKGNIVRINVTYNTPSCVPLPSGVDQQSEISDDLNTIIENVLFCVFHENDDLRPMRTKYFHTHFSIAKWRVAKKLRFLRSGEELLAHKEVITILVSGRDHRGSVGAANEVVCHDKQTDEPERGESEQICSKTVEILRESSDKTVSNSPGCDTLFTNKQNTADRKLLAEILHKRHNNSLVHDANSVSVEQIDGVGQSNKYSPNVTNQPSLVVNEPNPINNIRDYQLRSREKIAESCVSSQTAHNTKLSGRERSPETQRLRHYVTRSNPSANISGDLFVKRVSQTHVKSQKVRVPTVIGLSASNVHEQSKPNRSTSTVPDSRKRKEQSQRSRSISPTKRYKLRSYQDRHVVEQEEVRETLKLQMLAYTGATQKRVLRSSKSDSSIFGKFGTSLKWIVSQFNNKLTE